MWQNALNRPTLAVMPQQTILIYMYMCWLKERIVGDDGSGCCPGFIKDYILCFTETPENSVLGRDYHKSLSS